MPGPVEVTDDFTGAERRAQTSTEALTYGGLVATDGTMIDSRKKHREYMHRNGLALSDDYKQTWSKAEQGREKFFKGDHDHKERKQAIGRSIYELERGKKR